MAGLWGLHTPRFQASGLMCGAVCHQHGSCGPASL